ncbi:hypothetical protein OB955_21925 [Halobacteria archaeon AArc-m2/3/4]|uniref:Polysaccharide lyase 14 domain-containing protein n=2 Tax=Natronoglomus mannanivorans TaxID=2979990 RepID=A0ABT2QKF9_9EURY|nr:hypothetical protein [Halobacteria archaeon AArc-m2/3/4]
MWREPLDTGRWHQIDQFVACNTPGKADGVFRGWVDGELALEIDDLYMRDSGYEDLIGIQTLWLIFYFGGDYGSPVDQHALFDDFQLWLWQDRANIGHDDQEQVDEEPEDDESETEETDGKVALVANEISTVDQSTATFHVEIESMADVDSAYLWAAYAPADSSDWPESAAGGFEVTSTGKYELTLDNLQAGTEYEVRGELWNRAGDTAHDYTSLVTFTTESDEADDEPDEEPEDDEPEDELEDEEPEDDESEDEEPEDEEPEDDELEDEEPEDDESETGETDEKVTLVANEISTVDQSTATFHVEIESMADVDSAYLWAAYAPTDSSDWPESAAGGFEVTSPGTYELTLDSMQAGTEYEVRGELWNRAGDTAHDYTSLVTFTTKSDEADDEPEEQPEDEEPESDEADDEPEEQPEDEEPEDEEPVEDEPEDEESVEDEPEDEEPEDDEPEDDELDAQLKVNRLSVNKRSTGPWYRAEVRWTVSDGNATLGTVTTELLSEGQVVDSNTSSLDGSQASGRHNLRTRRGKPDDVRLTVTDEFGNEVSQNEPY